MFEFLLKRIASIIPTLVVVSMLIFGLQQLLPGDPAKILAGEEQDPTVVAYLRAKMHLDWHLRWQHARGQLQMRCQRVGAQTRR